MPKLFGFEFSNKDKKRAELRALKITLAVLAGLLLAGWVLAWQIHEDRKRLVELRQEASLTVAEQGLPPNSAKIGGPFQLTNQDGKKVSDADFRGKYLFVYFGYTFCPDMCPTGLTGIAHALDKLGADASKVQTLFITIDPARDTAPKVKDYIGLFHPSVVGLTGTEEEIAAVAKEYQVFYKRGEAVDERDYMMDHSTLIYLIGPQGEFVAAFPQESDPEVLAKSVKAALAKNPV